MSDTSKISENEIREGDFLSIGSQIEVGENSEVILLFSNGSITRVGPDTTFLVKDFLQKDFNNLDEDFSELNNEVGRYPPNPRVLYDIEGNMFEFSSDGSMHGGSWFTSKSEINNGRFFVSKTQVEVIAVLALLS
jgi:hypothetical protein